MAVLSNQVEGSTKARYKTNKNGQIVFSLDVYQKTKDGEKFVGSVINDNVATTQMPPVIPDVTKEMTEAINITMNTNDFVSRFGEYREADGALVGKDGKGTGYKVTEDYFRNQLKPNADMILAGLSPREKIRLYNNTLDKGKNPDLSYDDDLTGKGKEDLIKDALLNSLMRQTKKSKNIFAKVSEDKKDTKKGGKFRYEFTQSMKAKDPIISMGTSLNSKVWKLTTNDKGEEGYEYTPPANSVTGDTPPAVFVPYMKGKNINYTGLRAAMGLKATKI
jgi:hypothetical protein